ncbi:hypothetical protein F4677DRAFT_402637 [Hypoxylon crocopeplum]|nr:hypothetical protein F4677DRAFT_402637 [Hypoxylon crocopeplum]
MTDLGPLTTTFTPADNCKAVISGIVYTQTLDDGNTTTHKYHSLGPSATSSCYPPGFQAPSGFYSPGICPSGWVSACGSVETIGSATETRATCCPIGYACMPPPGSTETWSTLSCTSAPISAVSVTVPDNSNQFSKVTVLEGILINAAAINIRWQRNDFIASSTEPPTTSTASPTSSTPSTSLSSSSSSGDTPPATVLIGDPPSNYQAPDPLSTGAKVGIGVGIGGLLLISLAVGFWWWLRRGRVKEEGSGTVVQVVDPEVPKPPAEMWEQFQQEMQTSDNTHEMVTESNRHEVTGVSRPVELSSVPWR